MTLVFVTTPNQLRYVLPSSLFQRVQRIGIMASACLALALVPACTTNETGAPLAEAQLSAPGPSVQIGDDEEERFVRGSLLDIALHETGHMLIDQLDLPVLGSEEIAADNLATVFLLNTGQEPLIDAAVQAAGFHFLRYLRRKERGIAFPYDDNHELDVTRGYRIVCLLYGYSREHEALADRVGLSEKRKAGCPSEFAQATRSWRQVTEQYRGRSENRIRIVYGAAPPDLELYATYLRQTRVLEQVAGYVADNIRLPRTVIYEGRACGSPNAFYDRSKRTVTICYEMIPVLLKFFRPIS